MNEIKKEDLIFTDTAENIKNNDAILGTLEGPCADFVDSTRNGRHYSEELWEKTFNDPIVTELIENGGIVGELDHPTDREDTDSSRIAIIMRNKPVKKNGKLWAKFDILNTPLGKIAYTLAKAGFKLGISSRGSGDVTSNYDGTEEVDPSTYDFKAFDLVLLPAVKSARLNLVTESLGTKKFNYKKALLESLQNANEKERKIMQETLDNLNIKLYDSSVKQDESLDNINDKDSDELAVDNTKAELKEMQRVLKENKELAITITSLQEKLSVSYAKEAKANEDLERYSKKLKSLVLESKRNKQLSNRFNELTEELTAVKNQLDIETKKTNRYKNISNNLRNQHEELLNKYNKETALVEQLKQNISGNEKRNTLLKENLNRNIADLENNLEIKQKEYSKKLSNANKLVENYKGIANKAVDKYIELQARMLGINFNEIKNKLSENYSFNEIDSVCEELRKYKLNISNLPFKTGSTLNEEMKIKPISNHKESILPATDSSDEVDDQLRALAGL